MVVSHYLETDERTRELGRTRVVGCACTVGQGRRSIVVIVVQPTERNEVVCVLARHCLIEDALLLPLEGRDLQVGVHLGTLDEAGCLGNLCWGQDGRGHAQESDSKHQGKCAMRATIASAREREGRVREGREKRAPRGETARRAPYAPRE